LENVASRNQIIDSSKIIQEAFELESKNQLVSYKLSQVPSKEQNKNE